MLKRTFNKPDIAGLLFWTILLAGIFFRFYRLGDYPGGLYRDEATVAMNSLNLFRCGTDFVGNINPVYMADWGDGHSNLYSILTLIPLFINKGVMTPLISRLPQAVMSVVTLLCVYGIGVNTLGRRFALWSMFLLAINPWHIQMSRWGLDANLAPAFLMISVYFLVKSVKKDTYLIPLGIFSGITLYTYALTWAVVPAFLVLAGVYLLLTKKVSFNGRLLTAVLCLMLLAIPLGLFVLVNNGLINDIRLPFFSIVRHGQYRGDEVSSNLLTNLVVNVKHLIKSFLVLEDMGEPWEYILPWGFFYDLGRIFIVVGGIWMLAEAFAASKAKHFAWEIIFLILILAASISGIVSYAHVHRINQLYVPLILAAAYAITRLTEVTRITNLLTAVLALVFMVYGVLFWRDYTGPEYKSLVEAYYGVGVDRCLDMAMEVCELKGLRNITVEKAAQWPKLVLYSETISDVFVREAEYENYPIPLYFTTKDGIRIRTRIDWDDISMDSVYILYYTDADKFDGFELTEIEDWYVAVPITD